MKNYTLQSNTIHIATKTFTFLVWIIVPLWSLGGFSQVSGTVDSTSVKIGEEIRYTMQVQADSTQIVVFPEGQTFTPLEVIESYKIDTATNNNRWSLTKEYALTQFDSGHYTIPRQKVMVGDQVFFTDSLKVEIRDVVVDTTKQKMFEIKPLVEVDASFFNWKKYIWWILGGLLVLGVIAFFLLRRKKRKEAKEKELAPYERAMLALRKIDESHLLEQDSHKEYYSQLSDTARKYIDEEVYDHAMESTTDELITKLDEEIKSGSLNLDKATIEELKNVLKTADMAKFAKSRPDKGTAKADRNVIERVINETKEAIPEPTEEELLADEEYRKAIADKKRKKKILFGSIGGFAIIAITLLIFIAIKGYDVVKDTLLGHPTKELAETEWISSAYGSPPITVTTPEILIRKKVQIGTKKNPILKGNNVFDFGDRLADIYVGVSYMNITGQRKNQDAKFELDGIVETTFSALEEEGAKNIVIKDEEYETLNGAKGIKIFGKYNIKRPKEDEKVEYGYQMLNFVEATGLQQVIVIYEIDNRYTENIAQRIINSVELRKAK
ncbi:BatD family protein [Aquimarina sp. AU474]|uniref:BatD family protein n=1 Tax=Aquimarina sp. AU474 TaxID=2108529 RepID=UPI000D694F21|nr:BatD family protein [Aquimarina sp. AU474]